MPDNPMRALAHRTDTTEAQAVHVNTFVDGLFDDQASDTRYELVGPAHEVIDLLETAIDRIRERGGVL